MVAAAVLAAGAVAYSLHPTVRRRASARPTGGLRHGWRPPLAISLLATALLLTGAFGLFELSTVAFPRSRDAAAAAGVAIAVWSAGSLLGGVVFGARAGSARSPRRRLTLLVLVLASLTLLPAAAPAVPILVPLLLVSGLAIAPTVAALYGLVASEVPAARGAEAFGWLSGAFQVGSALGAVAGGLVVQDAGAHAGYLAAGVVVALAAPGLALAAWRRRQRR